MTKIKIPELLPSDPTQAYHRGWMARDAIAKADTSINAVLAHPEPAGDVADEELLPLLATALGIGIDEVKDAVEFGYPFDVTVTESIAFARAAIALDRSRRAPVQVTEGEVNATDLIRQAAEHALTALSDALAEQHATVQPAEGEVAALVGAIKAEAKEERDSGHLHWVTAGELNRIAALLQHHQPPQPVAKEPRGCPMPEACLRTAAGRQRQALSILEKQRKAVRVAVAEALGEAFDCTRVWSAWSCQTMGPDDFALVAENDVRVAEIADAAIAAMNQQPQPAQELVCGGSELPFGDGYDGMALG